MPERPGLLARWSAAADGVEPPGQERFRHYAPWLAAAAIALGLYLSSRYSYLLFHSLVEVTTVAIGFSLFILTWNVRAFLARDCFKVLGIGYGLIALLDLLHALAYKGMNVFAGYDANLPTQLWIAARYLQAATLLAAPLFVRRKAGAHLILGVYGALVAGLAALVFAREFPDCYVEGRGLTPFKIASEYVIVLMLAAALFHFRRERQAFNEHVFRLLAASIVITAVSEMAFTTYLSVYGFANLLGHLLKLAAFYLIYRAVLVTGMRDPFDLVFRELKQRSAALEASNKELEAFAYSVSHDLRAPLRAIDGFSRIVVEDYGDCLDDEGRRLLGVIRDNTVRMTRLIEDILHFSRTGRQEMQCAAVDMARLAREVFDELAAACPQRRLRFELAPLPPAWGDRALLRQVLVNLLANAIKFTAPRAEAVIEMGGAAEAAQNAYFVRDNGVGFDMQFADKLFGVFQRLHGNQEFEGTGIGLAIVKRIVNRHGGDIAAEGRVDAGATFRFTLPRHEGAAP